MNKKNFTGNFRHCLAPAPLNCIAFWAFSLFPISKEGIFNCPCVALWVGKWGKTTRKQINFTCTPSQGNNWFCSHNQLFRLFYSFVSIFSGHCNKYMLQTKRKARMQKSNKLNWSNSRSETIHGRLINMHFCANSHRHITGQTEGL